MAVPNSPKHSGLSLLADAAEQARCDGLQILHSYPVKRKWETRRLNPNQAGIEWLESDANDFDDTDIEYQEPMGPGELEELIVDYSYGRGAHRYARPMFQIVPRDGFSGSNQSVTPCSCDRFDLSWDATRCDAHHEVEWDNERKVWKQPGMEEDAPEMVIAGRAPTVPSSLASMYDQVIAYAHAVQPVRRRQRCACGCQDGMRPVDSGEAQRLRVRGEWTDLGPVEVDHSMDALRYSIPPSSPMGVAFQSLAAEQERVQRLIAGLSDFSATLEGTFNPGPFELEVHGETVQGIQSFSIEVEHNDDNR